MKLAADLHIHTISSGHAYSTVEEYAKKASQIGLEAIAITDHGPAMPGGPHAYHFYNMRMLPKYLHDVLILKGVEANILGVDGQIDLPEDILTELDVVMVTFHPYLGYENQGEAVNTKAMLKAMDHPNVKIIAHPGNPMYPVAVPAIVEKARKKGILIEINNSSFAGSRKGSWDKCLEFAKEVKKQSWKIVINSDAHSASMLGNYDKAIDLVSRAGLKEKDIINTSLKKVVGFFVDEKAGK